jgi:hypothetical protein
MRKFTNANSKIAVIHLYEYPVNVPDLLWLIGVEFFDRSDQSLIRVGHTTENRKVIRLKDDDRVVGVNEFATSYWTFYYFKFKIARVV